MALGEGQATQPLIGGLVDLAQELPLPVAAAVAQPIDGTSVSRLAKVFAIAGFRHLWMDFRAN
jgi:hypothetical protein